MEMLHITKIFTIKNILIFFGVIGFGFTVFSFALFMVGGILMTQIYDDMNSGNYTKYKQDVTLTSFPPSQDEINASHIASPLLHMAPFTLISALFIMFFYICIFTKFDKPKFNNPLKKPKLESEKHG